MSVQNNPSPSNLPAKALSYLRGFPAPVWLLLGATLVESVGRFMVIPYLSLYMRGAGVNLGSLGLVLGAAPVANVLFGAWGGQLSDKLGRKPVQILGVSISGLSMFGFAVAGANPYVLALLNFMNGMTRTFYRPATNAALADHCPAIKRSEAFALNRIAINAAFGLGPILGVMIFQTHPLAGFVIAGSINLAVGLFIALVVPESAPLRRKQAGEAPAATPNPVPASGPTEPPAWKMIARDAGFWVWTVGMMFVWGAYDLIQSFLPLHFQSNNVALWTYGSILTTNALVCVFLQLPVSRALRQARFAPHAGLSKLLMLAGFLGFAFLRQPHWLIMAMFVLSLGEVWGSAVQVRYVPEHARPALLGRYMGLSMVSELGRAIGAPAAGFLMAASGGESVFVMAAGMVALGGVLLYASGRQQDKLSPGR